MIVDSGVWIDHFLDRTAPTVTFLRTALGAGRAVFLTPAILQEVLQGTRNATQFARYERLLALISFAQIGDSRDAAVVAGNLYARLRHTRSVPANLCCPQIRISIPSRGSNHASAALSGTRR